MANNRAKEYRLTSERQKKCVEFLFFLWWEGKMNGQDRPRLDNGLVDRRECKEEGGMRGEGKVKCRRDEFLATKQRLETF